MKNHIVPVTRLRKLVIYLYDHLYFFDRLKNAGRNDSSQLVHNQHVPRIQSPGPLDRLSIRMGVRKKQKSPFDEAVSEAYRFVSRNYQPGSEVILLVDEFYPGSQRMMAAETLAGYLYDGTSPDGGDFMRQRIPIHCIAGRVWFDTESGARFYDEVKSNFPLGIKHIKLWTWSSLSDPSWIYSITYDSDGGVVSKEISLTSGDTKELDICIYATQDIIHYKPERMLSWDQQIPAWTHVLNEYPSEILGKSPSESEVPFGMYRHELQKYPDRHPLKMVWKATRR